MVIPDNPFYNNGLRYALACSAAAYGMLLHRAERGGATGQGIAEAPGGRLPSHPPFRRAEMEGRRSRGGAIGKGDGRSLESMAQRFRRAEMIPDATCFPARSSLPEII